MRTTAGSTSVPESNGRAEFVFSPNGWMKADATASTPAHAMA
jgi:hypothetical protein